MAQLILLQETKISDILAGQVESRLEASGVLAKDGIFYVIFDNLADIACLGSELSPGSSENRFIRQKRGRQSGFEDIAYDPWSYQYYGVDPTVVSPGAIWWGDSRGYCLDCLMNSTRLKRRADQSSSIATWRTLSNPA